MKRKHNSPIADVTSELSNFTENDSEMISGISFVDMACVAEKLKGKAKYSTRRDVSNLNSTTFNESTSRSSFDVISICRGGSEDICEVGIAHMDIRSCTLNLCQFVDTPTFEILKVRLSMLDPVEILLADPRDDTRGHTNAIIEVARDVCSNPEIVAVQKKFFDDVKGTKLIQYIGSPEASNIDQGTLKQYLCMSASYCLVTYMEQIQNMSYATESVQILYECIKDRCMIDLQTCKNLNVIKDLKEKKLSCKNTPVSRTLFSVLNTCSTEGGAKTLRSNLLQPSCDLTTIVKRQDAVEELKLSERLLSNIRSQLNHIKNMEFVIAQCVHIDKSNDVSLTKRKILELTNLRGTLDKVYTLRRLIVNIRSEVIHNLATALHDKRVDEIYSLISQSIDNDFKDNQNINQHIRKNFILYAVKSDRKMLEVTRRCFEGVINEAEEIFEKEAVGIENCRLNFVLSRGFYYIIQTNGIPNKNNNLSKFLNVCENKMTITFTSRHLIRLSEKANDCVNEILIYSKTAVDDVLLKIRKLIPILYRISEFISHLDFICALSYYSVNRNTIKPAFSSCLVIKQCRHPILEISEKVVPNDVYIAPESCMMLITGPNMSGKTTFMKQVCLLQILTQVGCMIPAQAGRFPIFEKIFSRLSYNDDIVSKLSGFAMEMCEMRPILNCANEKSLIAIDELGRSTSTEEGLAISYSIIEHLLSVGSFTMFATHFLNLSQVALNFSKIENYHFSSEEINTNDVSRHADSFIIKKGRYNGPLFGFGLASASGFPKEVIGNAEKMAREIRNEDLRNNQRYGRYVDKNKLIRLGYKIIRLLSIEDQLGPSGIAECLRNIKIEYQSDLI